jgi:uncharacterized protein (TIGR02449 family)
MDDILRRLELQIQKLLESQGQLERANAELHKTTNKLSHEKASLINKQHKAISQIKSLVLKLKAIERLP